MIVFGKIGHAFTKKFTVIFTCQTQHGRTVFELVSGNLITVCRYPFNSFHGKRIPANGTEPNPQSRTGFGKGIRYGF